MNSEQEEAPAVRLALDGMARACSEAARADHDGDASWSPAPPMKNVPGVPEQPWSEDVPG